MAQLNLIERGSTLNGSTIIRRVEDFDGAADNRTQYAIRCRCGKHFKKVGRDLRRYTNAWLCPSCKAPRATKNGFKYGINVNGFKDKTVIVRNNEDKNKEVCGLIIWGSETNKGTYDKVDNDNELENLIKENILPVPSEKNRELYAIAIKRVLNILKIEGVYRSTNQPPVFYFETDIKDKDVAKL